MSMELGIVLATAPACYLLTKTRLPFVPKVVVILLVAETSLWVWQPRSTCETADEAPGASQSDTQAERASCDRHG